MPKPPISTDPTASLTEAVGASGLNLGSVMQLAWVTADIDATELSLSALMGSRWTRLPDIEFGPEDCTFRGEPASFVADISLSYVGDLQLEIIRPNAGDSIYTEFLAATGGGLHHVCFEVADVQACTQAAVARGFEVIQRGVMAGGLLEFAYLDLSADAGGYIEVTKVAPAMRRIYDDIREKS